MSSSTEIQRTTREEFRERYGEGLAQGYHFPRPPYRAPEPEPDDISELYYKVREYMKACGLEDRDFLARLRDAEEVLDEAQTWVDAFEPETSYDEMLDDYEDDYDRWED